MKTRIASTVALAAAIALGATGCGLIAPQSTLEAYAPSDGVDVNLTGLDLRNVMLIADESGDNFNVVFGAVNHGADDVDLTIKFVGEGSKNASAEFTVPSGSSLFGSPDGDQVPVLVSLPGLKPGATIDAYFQTSGSDEKQTAVTVLDGTLAEYRDYVLPSGFSQEEDETASELEQGAADENASQSKTADDTEAAE